jgi:pimeloyl-ACP methyl ester carboxylesterase
MSVRSAYRSSLFVTFLLVTGCAALPPEITTQVVVSYPCEKPPALVLVADGAGNFRAASRTLTEVVEETHAPLCVQPVIWSHGYCRILADQMDQEHLRAEGKCLAEQILAHKQRNPETPIYLVAHSAGTGVVLSAAESLPPDTVERIILLAPAVSTNRDLRAALAAAREGVDVFYSKADWWYLGMGVTLIGTADRHWDAAAGRVGFRPLICCPKDSPLYEKLRQYPWQECLSGTGHKGGHYGAYQPGFLKMCVLPLLGVPGDTER